MNLLIVIPARYKSTRFPGKPLATIAGKSLLYRVWLRCVSAHGSENVVVATDSEQITAHCEQYGMRWILTPESCLTGTDRVAAAAELIKADFYINVQGDEPLVEPSDIRKVIDAGRERPHHISNAYCGIGNESDYYSQSVPKVVFRPDGRLLYMSRAPIPGHKEYKFTQAWKQVCIYGFPPEALSEFTLRNNKTRLEEEEDIEILRFLELGYEVQMIPVSKSSIAVDFPEDVARVEQELSRSGDPYN